MTGTRRFVRAAFALGAVFMAASTSAGQFTEPELEGASVILTAGGGFHSASVTLRYPQAVDFNNNPHSYNINGPTSSQLPTVSDPLRSSQWWVTPFVSTTHRLTTDFLSGQSWLYFQPGVPFEPPQLPGGFGTYTIDQNPTLSLNGIEPGRTLASMTTPFGWGSTEGLVRLTDTSLATLEAARNGDITSNTITLQYDFDALNTNSNPLANGGFTGFRVSISQNLHYQNPWVTRQTPQRYVFNQPWTREQLLQDPPNPDRSIGSVGYWSGTLVPRSSIRRWPHTSYTVEIQEDGTFTIPLDLFDLDAQTGEDDWQSLWQNSFWSLDSLTFSLTASRTAHALEYVKGGPELIFTQQLSQNFTFNIPSPDVPTTSVTATLVIGGLTSVRRRRA